MTPPRPIPVITIPTVLAERVEAALEGRLGPLAVREVAYEVRTLLRAARGA